MGKKTPPKGELDGSPRRPKAPRLDLVALADPAVASPLEASNLMEEGAEGTSSSNRCNHVLADDARGKFSSSLMSKGAGTCVGCRLEDAKGGARQHRPEESSILVCLECGRHLCCGVGEIVNPFGHSRAHAMKDQHWVAVLYDDAGRGYCFNCDAEVGMPGEFEVDGYAIGTDVIRDVVSWLPKYVLSKYDDAGKCAVCQREEELVNIFVCLGCGQQSCGDLASYVPYGHAQYHAKQERHWVAAMFADPGAGFCFKCETEVPVYPEEVEMPECLFALDKLRARLLAWDAAKSLFGMVLKELFVETGASGGMLLDPEKLFQLICWRKEGFKPGKMQDSHELLSSLHAILNEDEESDDRQSGAPTIMDSIFGFELSETLSCKCSFSKSAANPLYDLPLPLPSKGHPTKSVASPQTSESLKSRRKFAVQLFPANELIQTVAESGGSHLLGSETKEVIVEETPKPLELDSTEAQRICQSKDGVQDLLHTQKNKVSSSEFSRRIIDVPVKSVNFLPHILSDVKVEEMNEMTANSIVSIEDCLLLFSEQVIEWRCYNCANEEQMAGSANECKSSSSTQPHASDAQSQIVQTAGGITEGTSSGMSCGEKDLAACSITDKEPECHEGILPTEKQTDLLKNEHSEDVSRQIMMYQDMMKQLQLDSSSLQLKDGKNEHKDNLKRAGTGLNKKLKNSEHVRFEECLDVERFMDPSSVDKDNSLYRLAGVVEHRGTGALDEGHYVAYVRARRLGNHQQQSSCSFSLFRADDSIISRVTLEEVLQREAYILFYERVEG
ncbi:ubiquitin carboxyl-terminal hydrolase 1-like [Panicum miliaceum]|uniref:Ubiquitin carboxyl-terminal hydrolase 1-like n=1 Tax=Panicum miliaceum TaxID=4540 RepID=A0A3L6TSV2_PANMI|nr:ubiquitin carboxyl-terminal hydrolase 1-like [Panicum miliaceum]